MRPLPTPLLFACLFAAVAPPRAAAQDSLAALRVHGTGSGQQDRVRIPIDDDGPGPDASTPADLGAGDFTVELWLRGSLADNPTTNAGGDVELFSFAWINGNVVVDRDVWGGTERDWGISVAGGTVRFGTGRGDDVPLDPDHTLEGGTNVLDGMWHHVACVREAVSGTKRIYVDGLLDIASSPGVSRNDISFPDDGAPGAVTPWGPYLVLGAEKHDAGPGFPSFAGHLDELRLWSVARSGTAILQDKDRVVAADAPGLVGSYRFEEGAGTLVADSSAAGGPDGELIAGVPGNGEWVLAADSAANVAPVAAGPLPAGFVRSQIAGGLQEPTELEVLPDGRILIAERGGRVLVLDDGVLLPAPLVQLPVDATVGEHGLVGMVADPDFASTGWLYLYYTTTEPRNRVGRLTVTGNVASLGSEIVVWENDDLAALFHHGGGLAFDGAGRLHIATGDQLDSLSAQATTTMHGKLLRVEKDGSIPPDNPFLGTPGTPPALFATGLRNPFRLVLDAPTGRLWVGDVGGNTATSWEELDLAAPGANYGWPKQEGQACYVASCQAHTFPAYAYRHDDPDYWVNTVQGSLIAGPVYRRAGLAAPFPEGYEGNVLVGDYANQWIRRVVLDGDGALVADPVFVASPAGGSVVDLELDTDGALLYATIGTSFTGTPDEAAVWRVRYVGNGNQPPVVDAYAAPMAGESPLDVQFSSLETYDPDDGPQPLSFLWDFGDGGSATGPDPFHQYTADGLYPVTLTVSDGEDTTAFTALSIAVGDPPVPTIASPRAGTAYRAGDVITFAGGATDPGDGVLPAAALDWQVVLVHDDHTHPFLGPLPGVTGGTFTIPTTGHPPEHTSYEIFLTATDADGLLATTSVVIEPEPSLLVIDSIPSGIPVFLDGEPQPTPFVYESLIGFEHALLAQDDYALGGIEYAFASWSTGPGAGQTFVAPEGGATVHAIYAPSGVATGTLAVPVPAPARNAEHTAALGQQPGNAADALALCVGRDGGGALSAGLEFPLDVPPGATILSARVDLVATADNAGSPSVTISGYDVADAPPFVAGNPTPLLAWAPATSASVPWTFPVFANGNAYATPDLSAIVQEVVDRPDWAAGGFLGLVLDGAGAAPGSWRCFGNADAVSPPLLDVTYETSVLAQGAFVPVGTGLAGTSGLPVLAGVGDLSPGSASGFQLYATSLRPLAPVTLLGGVNESALPFKGGVLALFPILVNLPLGATSAAGAVVLAGTIPPAAPGGVALVLQLWCVDPTGPAGLTATNGLRLEIP